MSLPRMYHVVVATRDSNHCGPLALFSASLQTPIQ